MFDDMPRFVQKVRYKTQKGAAPNLRAQRRNDMDKFAFRPENLYEKGKFGRWTAFSNPIPLCIGYTLNAQLDSIKCHFKDCLKAGQKLGQTKQTGLKR